MAFSFKTLAATALLASSVIATSGLMADGNTSVTIPGVTVLGKKQIGSTAEPQSIIGQYRINYENKNLQVGDRVYFLYGFKKIVPGFEGVKDVDWFVKGESEMIFTESEVWTVQLEKTLYNLRISDVLSNLQFVFKIVHNDGTESYDKGSQTALGFYESETVLQPSSGDALAMCVDASKLDVGGYCELKVKAIERN